MLWRGDRVDWRGFSLDVLHPAPGARGAGNDRSLVLAAEAGGRSLLLTGDLPEKMETILVRRRVLRPVSVLKVAHHGSRSSTSLPFLSSTAPRWALISAGRRNAYGHPSDLVLDRLARRRAQVLRTDRNGRIRLRWHAGGPLRVEVEPGAGARRSAARAREARAAAARVRRLAPRVVLTTRSASSRWRRGRRGRRYTAAAMSSTPATTLAVVGPTCTGKSALALALARRLGGELVNADALQVYRGLDRGTAKPDAAARAAVPHHLLDLLDPREPFSAGEFARRARVAIADIAARGRLPIVVGGSGFYLRALWRGLAPVPPVPDEVRAALRRRLEAEGSAALYDELRRRDPELASRLTPADRQRVVRGLEVLEATGRPLSSWQRETAASGAASDGRSRIDASENASCTIASPPGRMRCSAAGGWTRSDSCSATEFPRAHRRSRPSGIASYYVI